MRPVLRLEGGCLEPIRRVRAPHTMRDILAQLENRFDRDPTRIAELRAALDASRLNV